MRRPVIAMHKLLLWLIVVLHVGTHCHGIHLHAGTSQTDPNHSARKLKYAPTYEMTQRTNKDIPFNEECTLAEEMVEHYSSKTRTIHVDDALLKAARDDINKIVNCARDGDQILFDTRKEISPASTIIVSRQMTFGVYVDPSVATAIDESEKKVTFVCPSETTAVFAIERSDVTIANIIISGCFLSEQAPITVSGCLDRSKPSAVSLYYTSFQENEHDTGCPGIHMFDDSCTRLVLESVKLLTNSCLKENMAVVMAGPDDEIVANGMTASENGCSAMAVKGGKMTVRNSTFSENKGFYISNVNKALGSSLRFTEQAKGIVTGSTFTQGRAGKGGIMYIASKSDVEISSTTFDEPYAYESGAAIHVENSMLSITASNFSSGEAKVNGGAIFASSTEVTLEGIIFTKNTALDGGSAVYTVSSTVDIANTEFEENGIDSSDGGSLLLTGQSTVTVKNFGCHGNVGRNGGCIFLSNKTTVAIDTSEFSDCRAAASGGAIHVSGSDLKAVGLLFTGNMAQNGGGLSLLKASTVQLTNNSFTGQSATRNGGSIFVDDKSKIEAVTVSVQTSHAYSGGAIFVQKSTMNMNASTFTENKAKDTGGALHFVENEPCSLNKISFEENEAGSGGAGVFVKSTEMTIVDLDFLRNTAETGGGAMAVEASKITAKQLSIVENNATNGGGLSFMAGSEIELQNCNISKNHADFAGGGILSFESTVNYVSGTFEANTATNGAGCHFASGSMNFSDVTFTENEAATGGGAIFGDGVEITVGATTMENNRAKRGGAMQLSKTLSTTLTSVIMEANTAIDGGAIYARDSNLDFSDVIVFNHNASKGGGIYAFKCDVVFNKVGFSNNEATSKDGGGISLSGGTFKATESIVDGNKATKGAGFYLKADTVELTKCEFTNNKGWDSGGAVFISDASVTIEKTTFDSNSAEFDGGALSIDTSKDVTMDDVKCLKNTAGDHGGCSFVRAETASMTNMYVEKNVASTDGGGLYFLDLTRIDLTDSQIVGNTATVKGGGAFFSAETLSISSSTFKGNNARKGAGLYAAGGTIELAESTLSENESSEEGGAFFGKSVYLTAKDFSIIKNKAVTGAGLYLHEGGQLIIPRGDLIENVAEGGGGALFAEKLDSITISETDVESNGAKSGAGFYVSEIGALEITDVHFIGHSVEQRGAAMYATQIKSATIKDATVQKSEANYGGAFYFDRVTSEISNTDFLANRADEHGGAASFISCPSITLTSVTFTGNNGSFGGGFFQEGSVTSLSKCKFEQNNARNKGGAIYSSMDSSVEAIELELSENTATSAGAIFAIENRLILTSVTAKKNKAFYSGGALLISSTSVLRMSSSTFEENVASEGGALMVDFDASVILHECSFDTNEATADGGAVSSNHARGLQWSATKFTKNSAAHRGGSVFFRDTSVAVLSDVEFTGNRAREGGAVSVEPDSAIVMSNCIFTDNAASDTGGAVHAFRSKLEFRVVEIQASKAVSGGGMYVAGHENAGLTGVNISFISNSAEQEGGGLYLSSSLSAPDHILQNCIFKENRAEVGAGLYFSRPDSQMKDCEEKYGKGCGGVQLWTTAFEKNVAALSGGIALISDAYGLRYSCKAKGKDIELKTLKPLMKSQKISAIKCDNWYDNRAYGPGVHVQEFGTKSTDLKVEVEETTIPTLEPNTESIHLDVLKGLMMAPMDLISVDAFNNEINPQSEGYFSAKIRAPPDFFEHGTEVGYHTIDESLSFEGLKCVADPGNYTLYLEYTTDTNSGTIPIFVTVSGCPNGMELGGDMKCHECGQGQISQDGVCVSCPEGAHCHNHYIIPFDGRWQKSPCHEKTYACIADSGCRYPNRMEAIEFFDDNFARNCTFDASELQQYEDVICNEVTRCRLSVLCGSCIGNYGPLSKWRCAKCVALGYNITLYLMLVLWICLLAFVQITRHSPLRKDSENLTRPLISENPVGEYAPETSFDGRSTDFAHSPSHNPAVPASDEAAKKLQDELEMNRAAELIKILMNYLQLANMLASLHVNWMSGVKRVLEIAESFGGVSLLVGSFCSDCILSRYWSLERPVLRFLVGIGTPFFVTFLLLFFYGAYTFIRRRSFPSFSRLAYLTFTVVAYISYFGVTKLAVKMFYCVSAHDSPDRQSDKKTMVLADDTSVVCYEGVHLTLMGMSIAVLILFTVGFPLFTWVRIQRRVRRGSISDVEIGNTMGFMYWPFQMRCFYWETIVFARKAALATISVFTISMGESQQQVYATVILFFFLYIQMTTGPYGHEFKSFNKYESSSLLLTTVTVSLGMVFGDDSPMKHSRDIVTAVLSGINIIFILSFLIPAYQILRDRHGR